MYKIAISIGSTIVLAIMYYLWLPPLSFAHCEGFLFLSICISIVITNITMWVSKNEEKTIKSLCCCCGIATTILLVGAIAGSTMFNATKKQQQLGDVKKVEYEEMIKQIDISQIPIVDEDLAKKQADKKIGEDIALGSRVELGAAAVQEVNGELVFVIPLEHQGFWKWNSNNSTPGYITVSASNQNKVNFETETKDGEKLKILYQPSSFFGYRLKRHIRNEGYITEALTEYTFEVDNSGRPFWVVTTYKNRTVFTSPEATGVVIVDAQTGETNWYSINDTPDWVDIIQPKEFIEDQINNWGELVHGFRNTLFGKKDMIKKTDLTLPVYVEGDCYYFTGMTSVGSDEAAIGFIMVNTRNKNAQICYMSGATESAAMSSAEGLVSDFGYYSTEPLPVSINGIPTYAMALKDKEGLTKLYAMVNINNYSIAAKGNSLAEVSRTYLQAVVRNSSTQVVASGEAFSYSYEGKVKRISSVVEEGSTYYYLVVEGEEDKIFMASYMVSEELSITRDGDTVHITYVDDKNGTVDIISFDNIAFATPVSEAQEKRNELDEGTSQFDSNHSQIVDVNPEMNEQIWEGLTDEERANMLDEYFKNN